MSAKTAEILCVGTELLMGNIVNTNAAVISSELSGAGIDIYHQSVIGDNPERLKDAAELALSRSDILITTGGLGPTYDDLTKETVAKLLGVELYLDTESWESIKQYFASMNRELTENNKKQAMLPVGCTVFPNPNGTAPGFAIEKDGKTVIMLPGPPREMKPMLLNYAIPYLSRKSKDCLVSRNLYFFGIGEAVLEQRLKSLMESSRNPTVAPYAKTGEVMLRLTARVEKGSDASYLLDPVQKEIEAVAGEYLYGVDCSDLQTAAVRALSNARLTVSCAESCTGGLVAERITRVSGSSKVFRGGIVSYDNSAKISVLGVKPETIERFGAVSAETALEMAQCAAKLFRSDIAVSVTGNAGPQGSEDKPVGLVYIGICSPGYSDVITLNVKRRDDDIRSYVKEIASSNAIRLILKACQSF